MEKFKIELFSQEYPDKEFPWFRHLSSEEQRYLYAKIAFLLKSSAEISSRELVEKINDNGIILSNFHAEKAGFSLSAVLESKNIIPQDKVFINWYRFDDIDQLYFEDLNRFFDNIWYPGPDDIDIFDESFLWMLSVSHCGVISIIQKD